jgi:hypothetical protein
MLVQILATTIARLYTASDSYQGWTYTGKMGAAAVVNIGSSYFFKLVDMKVVFTDVLLMHTLTCFVSYVVLATDTRGCVRTGIVQKF